MTIKKPGVQDQVNQDINLIKVKPISSNMPVVTNVYANRLGLDLG